MGPKTKGIYKGIKFISQIFVVSSKDHHEIAIGHPTDVKHVAHIGWDGPSGSTPSWMNEFKTAPDYAETSIGNIIETNSPWQSRDFEPVNREPAQETFTEQPPADLPKALKKPRRKKNKPISSPRSSSTSRPSRPAKPRRKLVEESSRQATIKVI